MKDREVEAKLVAAVSGAGQEADAGMECIPECGAQVSSATAAAPAPQARLQGGALQRWAPILLKFASVQMLVQVIGFASGILVLRNLSKREYALYTLCNTMLSAILILADCGISSAMTAIGGRVWLDRFKLSQLIRTALGLRRWMAAATLPFVIPVLVWQLLRNGASAVKAAILVFVVLVGCGLEFFTRIYAVALRLKAEVRQIQRQAMMAAVVKLAIVGAALLLWFNAPVAVFAVVAAFATQYWMLRGWAGANLDARAPGDAEMRSEILSVVKKRAPHSIYYCLQAQITIWLISIFGSADRVAEVGALSRLAVVFSIIGALTYEVVFPAFARIQSLSMARRRYLQIIAGYAGISLLLITIVMLFPGPVLAVLGKRYSSLHSEGVLMAISALLGAMEGLTWGLNDARAWIAPPMMFISLDVAVLAVLIHFLDLSTVHGVLMLSILSTVPSVLFAIWFGLKSMRNSFSIS